MYAKYVVGSGTQSIGVSHDIEHQVFKQVDPPYEELFDAVEDHALRCLIEPWKHLQNKESISYNAVKTSLKCYSLLFDSNFTKPSCCHQLVYFVHIHPCALGILCNETGLAELTPPPHNVLAT